MLTKYRCTECSAEDSDHQSYTSPPLALFCWNCGAGRIKRQDGRTASPYEQAQAGEGMLPIQEGVTN